ncbi:MAG: Sec-independent protein translocase subunit TatB [Betaproteobacteria bacterium]|nr:Sec-independent protein translocase subunit TatB [Betaproteobacteria bacterium]
MFDIGVTKLAIIGGIALVVIGPEKLPAVARTIGTLVGRARRYVADVKAEVNKSMDMEELRKMRESMESAAHDVHNSIQTTAESLNTALEEPTEAIDWRRPPQYTPRKRGWRNKVSAKPQWYKAQNRVRTRVQSGAARVARHRPPQLHR